LAFVSEILVPLNEGGDEAKSFIVNSDYCKPNIRFPRFKEPCDIGKYQQPKAAGTIVKGSLNQDNNNNQKERKIL
jgi:hypothetical protein